MALRFVTARWGDKYGPEYVTALRNQLPNLICLGDDWPMRSGLEYWWCKLEWFAPWHRVLRPVVWVDLDTYVFDASVFENADPDHFWMIDDFNRPQMGESGLMVIPKDVDHIWDALVGKRINFHRPDGAFLREFPHKRLNSVISGLYSYKRHCREALPPDASVVCFHGLPKPPDTKGWSKHHWSTLLTRKS